MAAALLVALGLLGHAMFWVGLINRLHGTGFPRPLVKLSGLVVHLTNVGLLVALACWFWHGGRLLPTRTGHSADTWAEVYLFAMAAVALGGLPSWAVSRWRRPRPLAVVRHHVRSVDMVQAVGHVPFSTAPLRLLARLPGNRSLQLDVDEEEVVLPRLPAVLDGLSILHLSDFHFSGRVEPSYFRQVVELSRALQPDLVAITGDICDKPQTIAWIDELFGPLTAPLGKFYVLGNHDLRTKDVPGVRRALEQAGCIDVAAAARTVEYRGQKLLLAGNERPWFESPEPELGALDDTALRILLAHTPDAIDWAGQRQFDLMLAGHTHGGQVCFPLIGPIVCPSLHGVRYAGGTFYRQPTLMHVSRGVSNLFPIRLLCPPEMTKLVLRAGVPA